MHSFRSQIDIPQGKHKINYESKILSLGSCFSENIGEKLSHYKFPVNINPFGILYNPESIASSIEYLLSNTSFYEADLFEHKGVWNSFYHHSRFSNTNKIETLNSINKSIQEAANHLGQIQFLLITFGTSWVYTYTKTGKIVSNCHKVPAKEFTRTKLSVKQIVDRYSLIINKLLKQKPALNIVFTVSPVRHLKDGADQNQLSKATLLMAVHELAALYKNVSYFPSYEIMMDDLRDYRFYNDDMVHPSPLAVNYIWDKFQASLIDDSSQKLMIQIDKIYQATHHRPFQPTSESHQKFIKATICKIETLEKNYKAVNFEGEKEVLTKQLL